MGFGDRLKEERERLGYNQTDFSELGRVGRKSQFNYESGERQPDVEYLYDIAKAGADVLYIVTGVRSDMALTPDERELLALYRSATLIGKAAAVGALEGALGSTGAKVSIGGNMTGHIVEGGLVNHGPMNIGPGKGKKK